MTRFLDIKMLKKWVKRKLKPDSKLREVIQLEEDYLLPEEYLAKMSTWLKLFDIEKN